MITIYLPAGNGLVSRQVSAPEQLRQDALWVDLQSPTVEELEWVAGAYRQKIPTMEELIEIEASSRFFRDDSGLHVRAYFLHEAPERSYNVTVGFILNQGRLFTVRSEMLESFRRFLDSADFSSWRGVSALGVLLRLLELQVDRMADLLEQLHIDLEALDARVFSEGPQDFDLVLSRLATVQDRNDKIRLGLMDKQRALSFLMRSRNCSREDRPQLREILQDIRSLGEHSGFLFEKVQFLMDATMSRINLEQNKIIKIFSIAAVVFLPPTLVASIYGMNFHNMPELSWPLGYPLAIVLMVAAGIAPYWYFKHKGWL